jgi:hypothetical protein
MIRILTLLLLVSNLAFAQKIAIDGVLKDSIGTALPSATVLLLNKVDSALVNFTSTNAEGAFEWKSIARQSYILKVSYVGYQTHMQLLQPSEENVLHVGEIRLKTQVRQLNEVTVTSEKAPVTIKKDTIEFNAGSFKTQENAVVEDLLKKLPGVEVDKDGTIRSQGEQVRRVTVDGKNFFGNDPKLATRNLPANAVAKVQVFDKKSDQATFTGIEDGQREKTINLELKEEKRKGAFGSITGGIGDNERYLGKASINQFRKGRQLSFLGMANNVNEQGFGMEEYMNFSGGSQQLMSGRGGAVRIQLDNDNQDGIPLNFGGRNYGLMNSYAGGVNFNKDLTKKSEVGSSYFYNHLNHKTSQELDRINYLAAGEINYNENSASDNTNDNHRLNFTFDHKVDSLNSLKLTSSVSYNVTDTRDQSTSELRGVDGELTNTSRRLTLANGSTFSNSNSLLWRHRFKKKGRTLASTIQFNKSLSDRDGMNDATINQIGIEERNILQNSIQTVDNSTYSASISYTEPLGKRKYLEGNYSWRINSNDFDREVFDINGGEHTFNNNLSNKYESVYQYHRAGMNFKVNRSKYNLTVGTSLQETSLDGKLILQNSTIEKRFQNILPVARFAMDLTSTKHLNLDYETNVQEPSVQQLQPVVDNSDPLNLYVGNPNLRPAYVQNFRLNYGSFNPGSFMNFFAFVDGTYTTNAITVSQTFNEFGARISKPVNVRDNRSISANSNFGFPVKKINSRFSISGNVTYQKGQTVINDQENSTVQHTIGGRLRYDYTYKEIVDFGLAANVSRQEAKYAMNNMANQTFFNNSLTSDLNVNFLKNFIFESSLEYLLYRNVTNDFKQTIPFVNLSLSRFMLKGKNGELKLSVNNILDKALGVTQTANLNYFEQQRVNSLGRYFMVSFAYSLNKQLNPMGFRPRGGMIRIMR